MDKSQASNHGKYELIMKWLHSGMHFHHTALYDTARHQMGIALVSCKYGKLLVWDVTCWDMFAPSYIEKCENANIPLQFNYSDAMIKLWHVHRTVCPTNQNCGTLWLLCRYICKCTFGQFLWLTGKSEHKINKIAPYASKKSSMLWPAVWRCLSVCFTAL